MPFHIRDAKSDDVPALARLHVQTFNETHRGSQSGGPTFETRERQWREAFTITDGSWFCFVVEDDAGELVGFAKGTPHDGGVPGFAAELNKIYVLRRLHGHGIGRLLLCNVANRFLTRGITSMLLFGEATNPSNRFYEAFGGERLYSESGEFHGAYGWRELSVIRAKCHGGDGPRLDNAFVHHSAELQKLIQSLSLWQCRGLKPHYFVGRYHQSAHPRDLGAG